MSAAKGFQVVARDGRRTINVEQFKANVEIEAMARELFYADLDAGIMPHMARAFRLAPLHVQQLYLSLAARGRRPEPEPSLFARLRSSYRRFLLGIQR